MASFSDLPEELLIEIFSYLPREFRVECSNVCTSWRDALDCPYLWKNMVVYLDRDLLDSDSSTIKATRLYHAHFRMMEFCWVNPRWPAQWMSQGLQEFSKRACHYIMMLQELYVQLNCVKIVDWYEVPRFKKITYHLSKFLRCQLNLVSVSFYNANFNKTECVKLLSACLVSENTISHLDISNCHHANPMMVESVSFISCVQQLSNLKILKLDYTVLCAGIIDAIITSRNTKLKELEVTIRECDHISVLIPEQTWKDLHAQCSKLNVAMHFKHVCHFDDICMLLSETIPLTSFTLVCGRMWDQSRSRQYRKTILLLIKNYCKRLERLVLQVNYNREVLDDLILAILNNCINLKCFNFNGVIESMELFKEICSIQAENKDNGFKYFRVVSNNLNLENHCVLTQLQEDFAQRLEECNVDFKISTNNSNIRNLVYVYY